MMMLDYMFLGGGAQVPVYNFTIRKYWEEPDPLIVLKGGGMKKVKRNKVRSRMANKNRRINRKK